MVLKAGAFSTLVVCAASAASAASCKAYNNTGTSYDDPNITVIEGIKSTGACCEAAVQYNLKAAQENKPVGKIAVWWRDYSLCLVKTSGKKPVPMLHTASVVIPDPSAVNQPMPLYLLSKEMSTDRGAVCLDGTPPGFYASFSNNTNTATSWILYFKGGGWCYNEASCASRAKGNLGSSDHFTPTFDFSGMMDSTATVNPEYHNYNRVVLYYCDGASFSGNKDEPYFYKKTNQTLYFRGARILDAMLDTLIQDHGLGKATDVLVSGGSAGGLSAYLHADHVKEYLQAKGAPLKRFKAAPVSGFFLMHEASTGELLYPNEMKYVFHMQNSSSGVNSDCLASYASNPMDAWRCIFANESYAHSKTPMFPLNSALDSWQMGNIWKGDKTCAKGNFAKCTSDEIGHLNGYLSDFMTDLKATEKFGRAGEGGFVESCLEHCGAQGSYGFDSYNVNNVKMRNALATWWNSDGSQAASHHWYLPCSLSTDAPHQCNPSCTASGEQEVEELTDDFTFTLSDQFGQLVV